MKLNNEFILLLSERRQEEVGQLIKELDFLEFNNAGNIVNPESASEKLMSIFYTVDYLLENKLATKKEENSRHKIPSFDMTEFFEAKELVPKTKEMRTQVARIHSTSDYLKKYWQIKLAIEPVMYSFMSNGFRTEKELSARRQTVVPLVTAILASLLTGYFNIISEDFGIWVYVLVMAAFLSVVAFMIKKF